MPTDTGTAPGGPSGRRPSSVLVGKVKVCRVVIAGVALSLLL
ncbi:MAG TPA: hypothetical protein VMS81_07355 [Methanomicrobiales archaeon]|nr:hypothetical protein [Methanomicrobiales archaeon]